MLTVYKYCIPITDIFDLQMPKDAKILSFQTQRDIPQIWALVNPDAPKESRIFRLAGTGNPINDPNYELQFIGTCQMHNGSLVWHLFELIDRR